VKVPLRRLVLLGPPAVGKGTLAGRLGERYGLAVTSTGAVMREIAAEESERGHEVAEYLRAGGFVRDELVIPLVLGWVDEVGRDGFLLDGFPRTLAQGESLDSHLRVRGEPLDCALVLEAPESVLVRRVKERLSCGGCGASYGGLDGLALGGVCPSCGGNLTRRDDDSYRLFQRRLEEFETRVKPLLPYYHGRGILRRIEAQGTPAEVMGRALDALGDG